LPLLSGIGTIYRSIISLKLTARPSRKGTGDRGCSSDGNLKVCAGSKGSNVSVAIFWVEL